MVEERKWDEKGRGEKVILIIFYLQFVPRRESLVWSFKIKKRKINKKEVKIMAEERKWDDNGEEKEGQERKKKRIRSCDRREKAES